MQYGTRSAGVATSRTTGDSLTKLAVPGSVKLSKNLGKKPAATPKASGFRSAALTKSSDSQYAGRDDPLSLREPPQGSGFDSGVQLYLDTDYLNADVHPDSLLADVEALFVQEQMLTEQVVWWQERVSREQTAKDSLQAAFQTQDEISKEEVLDLQRRIAACRDEQRNEDQLRQGFQNEAAELRAKAKDAQQQADQLRAKLEQIANQSSPLTAVTIRAAINRSLSSTQAVNKRPVQKYASALDQDLGTSRLNSYGSATNFAKDPRRSTRGDGNSKDDEGASADRLRLRPPPPGFSGGGGSLEFFAGMGLDKDNDKEIGR